MKQKMCLHYKACTVLYLYYAVLVHKEMQGRIQHAIIPTEYPYDEEIIEFLFMRSNNTCLYVCMHNYSFLLQDKVSLACFLFLEYNLPVIYIITISFATT